MAARRNIEYSSDETLTDGDGRLTIAAAPEVILPHLFVAIECDQPEAGVARYSLAHTDRVVVGRGAVRSSSRACDAGGRTLTISIADSCMSSKHVSIVRVGPDCTVEDLGSRNGTYLNGRVVGRSELSDGALIQMGHTILRYRVGVSVPVGEAADIDSVDDDGSSPLATIDPSLARRAAALGRVARSASPILILGETGTGKEVLARAIHRLSGRKGPFVAVNCGAIPATLVEAQLFGHVRGAFSGAVGDALGLIRSADGGTLLLDEIGDLPAPAQAALLRVLQEREVSPLGGVRTVKVDLRVVAATHRPIEALVASGTFRGDLFARIAGFTFRLPPLRQRRDDIGLMIAAFAKESPMRLMPAAAHALLRYDWPLNIRELRQALEVATALADPEGLIDLVNLPPAVADWTSRADSVAEESTYAGPLHARLVDSLRRHRGNVSEVAREFGKGRKQVQRWVKRLGIDVASLRRP
ncbi:MAG: sigma 54-interacting transcriptional regulator [Myxococcota bacterium]|nr:sigma 54-interacting transcriptional regulator [Myxococcota bacterium]